MAGYAPSVCNLISCVKQIMEYNNRVIVFVYGRCLSHGFMLLLFVVITDVVLVRTIISSSIFTLFGIVWKIEFNVVMIVEDK